MNQQTLKSMVTHLVQCSCNSAVECLKGRDKGVLRAKELAFKRPISALCGDEILQGRASMTWNSVLQGLISRCPQVCRAELVNIPRPMVAARWRETSDRKVLAPLALKQNTDNIIAGSLDMSRKRKPPDVDDCWAPRKRIRFADGALKPCSVVIRRASLKILLLQYKCVVNRPYVRLYDVLKEIPQEKEVEAPVTQNDFMRFLRLDSNGPQDSKRNVEVRTSHPTRFVSHHQIPFSSDYGRRLLKKDRHCVTQEVVLRKIERTEWYLKGPPLLPKQKHNPEVSYDKRVKYQRNYAFPKRQFYQNHESLEQSFVRFVCKPVCVELEMMDVAAYLEKAKQQNQEHEATPSIEVLNGFQDDRAYVKLDVCSANTTQVLTVNCAMYNNSDQLSSSVAVLKDNNNKAADANKDHNRRKVESIKKAFKLLKRGFKLRRSLRSTHPNRKYTK